MKEPMFTPEMRVWYRIAAVLLTLAVLDGWTSGGVDWGGIGSHPAQLVGALTLGYKGPVGDHTGYGILLAAGLGSLAMGVAMGFARRDRPVPAEVEPPVSQPSPELVPFRRRLPWHLGFAVGIALVAIGLALDTFIAALGVGAVTVSGVGWWEAAGPTGRVLPAHDPDPLVAWIASSKRGVRAARVVVLAFVVFGVYMLFSSFAHRSGAALGGIVALGVAVLMSSWVEMSFGDRRPGSSDGDGSSAAVALELSHEAGPGPRHA